ncbi:MAG: helix-turn-helix transcriptional regulator, partial [Bacteroidales bacterium]|nr:helix-turn-helix transcriptional regulator [Bacteroidales bacterium]
MKQYCLMESGPGEQDVCERVIPTEHIQLMFHYRDPFVVQSGIMPVRQPFSIISGLSHSYSDVSTHGLTGVIFINFKPAGACHFFEFPLSEIENQSVDLRAVYNREIHEVEEKLQWAGSYGERIALIEQFLVQRYREIPLHDELLIQSAVMLIKNTREPLTTPELAGMLSVTPKSLERKFAAYIGKTPRQFTRIVRFNQCIRDIGSGDKGRFTQYAYRNGYYDQSHFIHEFKTYSGYTPGEFFS